MYRHPKLVAGFFCVLVVALVGSVLHNVFYGQPRYRAAVMRADSAVAALAVVRQQVAAAQSMTDRATASALIAKRHATRLLATAKPVRDTLVIIARDTAASADTIRVALAAALDVVDSVTVVADGLLVALDSVTVAHARERAVWQSWVAGVDTALAAERALRVSERCRIWRFPCPSRRQSAVLAALATLVVLR